MQNIYTEAYNTVYQGIKRLWQAEVDVWTKDLDKATYSIYRIPNSNYGTVELWVIDKESDLATLKQYLKDFKRVEDFKRKQRIDK